MPPKIQPLALGPFGDESPDPSDYDSDAAVVRPGGQPSPTGRQCLTADNVRTILQQDRLSDLVEDAIRRPVQEWRTSRKVDRRRNRDDDAGAERVSGMNSATNRFAHIRLNSGSSGSMPALEPGSATDT
jgi:hypothetical protein